MMRHFILLALLSATLQKAFPQATYDSSFRLIYYDQKYTMFENMKGSTPDVVWLGDSITDGCEWSELFPHLRTCNRGVSSDVTFGVLNRLREIARRKPRKIFIMIGINDVARGIPDTVILRNYQRMIDTLVQLSPSTRIYFQTLLPTNNDFTNFKNHQNKTEHILFVNAGLQKLCAKNKVTFIDLYTPFTDAAGKLDTRYTNDGLHLTGAGYQHWKELLLKGKYL